MTKLETPEAVVDALEKIYNDAVGALTRCLEDYLKNGKPPSPDMRQSRAFCYPSLTIRYDPDGPPPPISRAFGKMSEAGTYSSTITRPDFLRPYLIE